MSSTTPSQDPGNYLIPASRVSCSDTVQTTDRTQTAASIPTTTVTATSTIKGTPFTVDGQTETITASSNPTPTPLAGKLPTEAILGLGIGLPVLTPAALLAAFLVFRQNLQKKRQATAHEREMLALDPKEFENLRLGRVKGEEALISPYSEDTSSTLWEQRTHKTARRELERSGDRPAPGKSIFKNPATKLLRPLPSLNGDGASVLSERTED
jgi:hypothetical protein